MVDSVRRCEACGAGKYLNSDACSDKEKCEAGTKYEEDNTKSKSCNDCEDGTYQSAGNHNNPSCTPQSPTACNQGEKLNSGGKTKANECLQCDPGQYQDANSHKESTCKAQSDCNKGQKYVPNREKKSSCTSCPNGQYQENPAKSESCSLVNEVTCGSGKKWQDNLLTAAPTCPDCVPDTFQPAEDHNIAECTNQPLTKCSRGHFFTSGGLTSKNTCSPCTPGQYQGNEGHTQTKCQSQITCGPGERYVDAGKTAKSSCEQCGKGEFQSESSHRLTGCQTDTASCKRGERFKDGGAGAKNECLVCGNETYQDDNNHIFPVCKTKTDLKCEAGERWKDNGIDKKPTCEKCDKQTYEYQNQNSHNEAECNVQPFCSLGELYNDNGINASSTCSQCDATNAGTRTYQDQSEHRSTSCVSQPTCDPGEKYEDGGNIKRSTCAECLAQEYQDASAHTEPNCKSKDTCGAGAYAANQKNDVASADCTPCGRNHFIAEPSHTKTECEDHTTCGPGEYLENAWSNDAGVCKPCTQDFEYMPHDNHRHASCFQQTKCNSGTFLDIRGTAISITDQEMCTTCPDKFFMDETAHRETECKRQVVCTAGQFFNPDNRLDKTTRGECKVCEDSYQDEPAHQMMKCKTHKTCGTGTNLNGATKISEGSCVDCGNQCCKLPVLANAAFDNKGCSANSKQTCIASCTSGFENSNPNNVQDVNHVAYTCQDSTMYPFAPDGAVDTTNQHKIKCTRVACPAITSENTAGFSKYAEHDCVSDELNDRTFESECNAKCKEGFYRDPNSDGGELGKDSEATFQCSADQTWVGKIVCIAAPTLETPDKKSGGGSVPILDSSSFEAGLKNIKVQAGSGVYSWVLIGAPEWAVWQSGKGASWSDCDADERIVGQWRCRAGDSVRLVGNMKFAEESQYQLFISVVDHEFGTSDSITLTVEVLRDLKTTARNSKGEVDIPMSGANSFTFKTTVRSYFEVKFFAATGQGLVGEEEVAKRTKAVQRVCAVRKKLSESQLKIFEFFKRGCIAGSEGKPVQYSPLIPDSACDDPATLDAVSKRLRVARFKAIQYNTCIYSEASDGWFQVGCKDVGDGTQANFEATLRTEADGGYGDYGEADGSGNSGSGYGDEVIERPTTTVAISVNSTGNTTGNTTATAATAASTAAPAASTTIVANTTAAIQIFDTVPVPDSTANILPRGLTFDGRNCTLSGWLEYDEGTSHSEGGLVMNRVVDYTVGLKGDKYVDGFTGIALNSFIVTQDVYYNYNDDAEVRLRTNASVQLEIFPHISITLSGETYGQTYNEKRNLWLSYNDSITDVDNGGGGNSSGVAGDFNNTASASSSYVYKSNGTIYTLKADTQFTDTTQPAWARSDEYSSSLYAKFWTEPAFNRMESISKRNDVVEPLNKSFVQEFPLFSADVEIRGGQPPYKVEAILPCGLKFERTYKIEGNPAVPAFEMPSSTDGFTGLKANIASGIKVSDDDVGGHGTGWWWKKGNTAVEKSKIKDCETSANVNVTTDSAEYSFEPNVYTEQLTFIVGLDDCQSDQPSLGSCNADDSFATGVGGKCVDTIWFDGKYTCECGEYRDTNCALRPKPSGTGPALGSLIILILMAAGTGRSI